MEIQKQITSIYNHKINITKPGLVAIFISARCDQKEDLRIEINGFYFRENPPEKNMQLFNIPPAFNGSKLKGTRETIIFLTVLSKGENIVSLIPKNAAFIENIEFMELSGMQDIELALNDKAEDGNNRPWVGIILVDLPMNKLLVDATIQKRFWDSDDIKIIINGRVKKNLRGGKYKFWYLAGGILGWIIPFVKGGSSRKQFEIKENLDNGIHYVEFWADRMPILHKLNINLGYTETKSEKRAEEIIKNYSSIIKQAAKEFEVDPAMVGAVIYQEQSANVNFIDTLTDYVGGLLFLNTSIGAGQVRVRTAELLESKYPVLKISCDGNSVLNCNVLRVECLKDPFLNIRYVAAKIKFSKENWGKAGFDIHEKPEILGTLYNIEEIDDPIKPHSNPEPNEFGASVGKNFKKVKEILNL